MRQENNCSSTRYPSTDTKRAEHSNYIVCSSITYSNNSPSYSAVSSLSGMDHNSTAFVGCDRGKVTIVIRCNI